VYEVSQMDRWTGGQRGRSLTAFLSTCLAVYLSTSCARIAPPPGGPPDAVAPTLVATRPESMAVLPDFDGDVEFIFDETVSEGSQPNLGYGNGDLERMVIVSPAAGIPKVGWERSRITVRPKDGWRPNTVYRVELLPGVTDLRRNRGRGGQVITFTTGAPLPTDSVSGMVIDWTTRQPARLAAIELLLLPDSLPYRTQSDSSGRFHLAPLPHGSYLARGYLDANRNATLDGREAWDSAAATPAPNAALVFWLAVRDTVGPRILEITARDSLQVEIQLTQPFDPYQGIDPSNVRLLLLPDSIPVPVASFRSKSVDDSLTTRAKVVADSVRADSLRRARPDTARAAVPAPAPRPAAPVQADRGRRPQPPVDSTVIKLALTRPALTDRLILRPAAPLTAEARYAVVLMGIRNVNQASDTAIVGFAAPKAPPPAAPKADSTAQAPPSPR
jgi:hypothetical protein